MSEELKKKKKKEKKKKLDVVLDGVGLDQSRRQIGRADIYCDIKAYIYCIYCASITKSSFKYYPMFKKITFIWQY